MRSIRYIDTILDEFESVVVAQMPKSALLTISVWDERIRLSLIGKTLRVLDTVSFSFSIRVMIKCSVD